MPLPLLTRSCRVAALFWTASLTAAHAAGVLELHAAGVQIYRCEQGTGSFAWTLQAPDATLIGANGKPAGHHFKGPTWQAADGSLVAGKPVAAGSPPEPGAAPWLVVQATSHAGAGLFAGVTYIVRSHTAGGAAPGSGCGRAGVEMRVPYTATYTFFGTR